MKNDPTIKIDKFSYTPEQWQEVNTLAMLEEMKEWDVTLMDGLEDEPQNYLEDDWDNINGDLVIW